MVTVWGHLPMLSLGLLRPYSLNFDHTYPSMLYPSVMPTLYFPLFKSAEVCKFPSIPPSDHPQFATTSNYLGYCTTLLPSISSHSHPHSLHGLCSPLPPLAMAHCHLLLPSHLHPPPLI